MTQIRDALELLTAQHEELDSLFVTVSRTRDAAVFDELSDKLATHLALEQELFTQNAVHPVVARLVPADVMAELRAEQVAMKRLLSELIWIDVDDPEFPELFSALGELMVGHAAWQEDELFTALAESLSRDELEALGYQLGSVAAAA